MADYKVYSRGFQIFQQHNGTHRRKILHHPTSVILVKMRSQQSSGFPFHLLLASLRHRGRNCTDSEARVGIGREDIAGRLALANGETKHLHLTVKARHTTDPTKSEKLLEGQQ